VANKANVIDVIVAADKAIVNNTANLAIEANKASFSEANKSLANSISIVLYSLTKYDYIQQSAWNIWQMQFALHLLPHDQDSKIGQQSTGSR
jgi:hypothetical protein